MGWASALTSGLGAIGGAAQGAAAAYPGIMQNQADTAARTDLSKYRTDALAIDQGQLELAQGNAAKAATEGRWERAFERRRLHNERIRADADRIRAEAERTRANMPTRTSGSGEEEMDARLARADRVVGRASPEMDEDALDHLARLNGFTDYSQALAVAGRGGIRAPAPAAPPGIARTPQPLQMPGFNRELAGIPEGAPPSVSSTPAMSDDDRLLMQQIESARGRDR